jgi:hypothetical protein
VASAVYRAIPAALQTLLEGLNDGDPKSPSSLRVKSLSRETFERSLPFRARCRHASTVAGPTIEAVRRSGRLSRKAHHVERDGYIQAEAEPLMRRALAIDEQSFGADHPLVALRLWNLAVLLRETERLPEALPLVSRAMRIYHHFSKQTGYEHPDWDNASWHYRAMLAASGQTEADVDSAVRAIMEE